MKASNINHSKSKNNLAIIYKNGIDIKKDICCAAVLLKESVQMNNYVSMYNLAHLYFYEETENSYDNIIDLLVNSMNEFDDSSKLLAIVLIKKYKNITFEIIENEIKIHLSNKKNNIKNMVYKIYKFILENKIYLISNYNHHYYMYKKIDFMYGYQENAVVTTFLMSEQDIKETQRCVINEDFYNGFGIQL